MIEIEEMPESEHTRDRGLLDVKPKDEPDNRLLTEDDEVNQEDPSSVNIPTQITQQNDDPPF